MIRFRGGGEPHPFVDGVHGAVEPFGPPGIDDFVLRRADGVPAYQLAVVVDDAAMRIEHVVRGDDLLRSTPRQLALYRALGLAAPSFSHVPLVLSPGGERLAKRTRPVSIAELRSAGVPAPTVVGALAASAGLIEPHQAAHADELVAVYDLARVPRAAAVLDGARLIAEHAT